MCTPSLKLAEPPVNKDDPWHDDALNRKAIADALTNLLSKETKPLVVSLHGDWGTGKTFLLKRWHRELENNGQKTIYFNAWEDDFLGDPLIAIFGQLKLSLQGSSWQEVWNSTRKALKPILRKVAFDAIKSTTLGYLDLDKKILSNTAEITFDEYSQLHEAKKELKKRLAELAQKIAEDTGQPLIFIVDELDRCRPTFSIELLERVKHLLDIPNIVFVFGIDRNQLKSSIQAVYGDIDAEGYLRRFFDMDFILPPAKPDQFCRCLIERHELETYFDEQDHNSEFNAFRSLFPKLCKLTKLSLREIEHCIRVLIFASKNTPKGDSIFPQLLCILVILRLKEYSLYSDYIQGKDSAAKLIDYFDNFLLSGQYSSDEIRTLDPAIKEVEITLYQSCITLDSIPSDEELIQQFNLLIEEKELDYPQIIAKRTVNQKRYLGFLKDACLRVCERRSPISASREHIRLMSQKIELAEMMIGY